MKKQKGIRFLWIIIAVIQLSVIIMTNDARSAIPEKINYQGYLTNATGNPVNTTVSMTFKIYTVASGGTALWTETQSNVSVNNGIYNVVLGSVASLGTLAFDVPYFLGVTVGTDAEMTPRQPLTSVAYAFTADTALDLVCTNCVSQTDVDQTSIQRRVSGTCAAGSSIRVINQDGTVTCETDDTGGTPSNTVTTLDGSSAPGTASEYSRGDHKHAIGTGVITSSHIQDGTIMNTDINASAAIAGSKLASDGSVMKSLIAGTNVSVTNNNNGSWTVNSTGGSSGWYLTGNTGTTPGTNFLGTTDNKALEVKVNNARALRIEPNATSPNLIGGYSGNTILSGAIGATISGGGESGFENKITDNFGTIGGGTLNISGNNDGFSNNVLYTTVGGGNSNTASGGISTVSGGQLNSASGLAATVGGGYFNVANADSATVGGGFMNTVKGDYSTIGGGWQNFANAKYATISGGGLRNPADVTTRNRVTDDYGTIGGGADNQAGNNAGTTDDAISATVGGGWSNQASGELATVGGGESNQASGRWAKVGGGYANVALADYSTVGGGNYNQASGTYTTVGGGGNNYATEMYATVGGGYYNQASGTYTTVGGGFSNTASGAYSTVGGGTSNTASGDASIVSGGSINTASGYIATVSGGFYNTAGGMHATIPGGKLNSAQGFFSFAAGYRAKANGNGSFVWGDSNEADIYAWGANQFVVRATGGFWLITAIDANGIPTEGMRLPAGTSKWVPIGTTTAATAAASPPSTDDDYTEKMVKENAMLKQRIDDLESRLAALEVLVSSIQLKR